VGAFPQAATIDSVVITAAGATANLNQEDLVGAARAPMPLTLAGNTLSLPGLFENWQASNWVPKGRFQYKVTTLGAAPLERFNVVDDEAYGDGGNGVVFLNESGASPQLELVWASGVTYVAQSVVPFFTGTMEDTRFDWGAEKWNAVTLADGRFKQELVQMTSTDPVATERYTYGWKQEGVLQSAQFLGVSNKLYLMGGGGTSPLTLVATFDSDTQVLTWTGSTFGQPWTRLGSPVRLPTQDLRWNPGQSSVLYVHFDAGLRPDNSTGPKPTQSTCVGKISLAPDAQVNHVQIARANRFCEIPSGTLDQLRFRCATADGETVDILGLGCGISFVVTLALRGTG